MLKAKLTLRLDIPGVMSRVNKKKSRVLYQTGAYGLTTMRRSIKAPKSGKKSRTVTVNGQQMIVPVRGRVLDAKTLKPVTKQLADAARRAMAQRLRSEGVGQPPRRGPTDKLRRGMHFVVDESAESVVIGAMPFPTQPQLSGAVSVPELLTKGGGERIGETLVQYAPRPFVQPAMEKTLSKMKQLIEKLPL